ncbi:MAG TPA: cupin domain-containing protein [Candidatus Acidoferrales bacterium]|nr:cupin domain-containing protein [Candidatus Acidoferrales bacterium]
MSKDQPPVALRAADCPPRARPSNYPAAIRDWLDAKLTGREKRPLGDRFGLTNFGVNLTRLAPGAISALRHAHTLQDEFVYVLEGTPTLVSDAGETLLTPGMCAGFRAGSGDAHQLVNRSDADVLYLEVGDRTPGDNVVYPDDDLAAKLVDGQWRFTHADGTPY